MSIPSSLLGFYKPHGDIKKKGVLIGKFIEANLNGLLRVACPEPPHEIQIIRQHQPVYMPVMYLRDGSIRLPGSRLEKVTNTFLIDEPLIELECQQFKGDELGQMHVLWVYTFYGARYKLQTHFLKPEELFGYQKDMKIETVLEGDSFFINYLATKNLAPVIKGARIDTRSFADILRLKATEYKGEVDPGAVITRCRTILEQYAARTN